MPKAKYTVTIFWHRSMRAGSYGEAGDQIASWLIDTGEEPSAIDKVLFIDGVNGEYNINLDKIVGWRLSENKTETRLEKP